MGINYQQAKKLQRKSWGFMHPEDKAMARTMAQSEGIDIPSWMKEGEKSAKEKMKENKKKAQSKPVKEKESYSDFQGNPFLLIPEFQRRKRIPTAKKDLELKPLNKSFGSVTKSMIGTDALRPIMNGNYFDPENRAIIGTDAHKLYYFPSSQTKYNGVYKTIQTLEKEYGDWLLGINFEDFITKHGKIDGQYPNYLGVIPKFDIGKQVQNVDYEKLFWFNQVLAKAKVLPIEILNRLSEKELQEYQKKFIPHLKKSYVPFLNDIKPVIHLEYKKATYIGDSPHKNKYENALIGANPNLLVDCIKFGFHTSEFSYEKESDIGRGTMQLHEPSQAILLMTSHADLPYAVFTLCMPVMIEGNLVGNKDEGIQFPCSYDLDKNSIICGGKNYEIDESLGFVPKAKKSVNSLDKKLGEKEIIEQRIEGLKMALEFEKNKKEKKLIAERIEGLEISLSYS